MYHKKHVYDSAGNKIQIIELDKKDSLLSKECYKYDKRNRRVEFLRTRKDGYVEKYLYDSLDNLLEAANYALGNKVNFVNRNIFDSIGNKIQSLHYYHDTITVSTMYEYNSKKQLTRQVSFKNNTILATKTYQYDKEGNVTLLISNNKLNRKETVLRKIIEYY